MTRRVPSRNALTQYFFFYWATCIARFAPTIKRRTSKTGSALVLLLSLGFNIVWFFGVSSIVAHAVSCSLLRLTAAPLCRHPTGIPPSTLWNWALAASGGYVDIILPTQLFLDCGGWQSLWCIYLLLLLLQTSYFNLQLIDLTASKFYGSRIFFYRLHWVVTLLPESLLSLESRRSN